MTKTEIMETWNNQVLRESDPGIQGQLLLTPDDDLDYIKTDQEYSYYQVTRFSKDGLDMKVIDVKIPKK